MPSRTITPDDASSDRKPLLFSSRSGNEWKEITATDETVSIRQKLLTDIALSPNLIVLCGLGTSLCLTDAEGTRLAPTMHDLWMKVSKDQAFEAIRKRVHYPRDEQNIERFLSQCQLSLALQHNAETLEFIARAERAIVDSCRFITPGVQLGRHELFLRKVARRSTRLPRVKVFTTNYDLAFESAASHTGFIAVDGFSHSSPSIFDGSNYNYDFVRRDDDHEGPEYIPNVFHLYKIHGSIDWEIRDERIVRVDQPDSPLIIYPRSSKFESSYNPPFLEMMSRLQVALRQPNTGLLIIGFGFNDEHIAQPILAALRSNVALKAIVVSPFLSEEASKNPHLKAMSQLIEAGDDRLAMLETSFEDLVMAMPDLVAATEDEEHRRRLSGVRSK